MASGHSDEQPLNFFPALLGWVFPGLGQIVLGDRKRGCLAMLGVLLLFFTGVLVGGIDAVDKDEDRLWFVGQAGVGPLAFATAYANDALLKAGRFGTLLETPPNSVNPVVDGVRPRVSSFKGLAHPNEFGTLFCFLAGLLNLVVILDAFQRVPPEPGFGRRGDDSRGKA